MTVQHFASTCSRRIHTLPSSLQAAEPPARLAGARTGRVHRLPREVHSASQKLQDVQQEMSADHCWTSAKQSRLDMPFDAFLTTCRFPLGTLKVLLGLSLSPETWDVPPPPPIVASILHLLPFPAVPATSAWTQRLCVQGQVTEFSRATASSYTWTVDRQGRRIFGARPPLRGGAAFSRTEEAAEEHLCGGWGLPHA